MQLMATLSHAEIIEACREYVERRLGLKIQSYEMKMATKGYPAVPALSKDQSLVFEANIENPSTPYRG